MRSLILALPEAHDPGIEHAADGSLDHTSALPDDMVADLSRPIKPIPEKLARTLSAESVFSVRR
jgi:hypothetical protein